MMELKPFVKWVGGKSDLTIRLFHIFSMRGFDRTKNRFVEPFVGAGAILLGLKPQNAVISDSNLDLITLWRTVRDKPEALVNLATLSIQSITDTKSYNSARERYNRISATDDPLAKSALLLALNRTCFNGLYRVNRNGEFNVPYNKGSTAKSLNTDNIYAVSEYLNKANITILCTDYRLVCDDVNKNDFVYLDPPYYPISKTAKFTEYTKNPFLIQEQVDLRNVFDDISNRGAVCFASNNAIEPVKNLYESHGHKLMEIDVRRSVNRNGNGRSGKEYLIEGVKHE